MVRSLLIVSILIGWSLKLRAEVTWTLRSEVIVSEQTQSVALLDLVGDLKLSPVQQARLALIEWPLTTSETRLGPEEISPRLRQLRQKSGFQSVQWNVPASIRVLRSNRRWALSRLEKQMIQKWQPRCSPCRLDIGDLQWPSNMDAAAEWKVELPEQPPKGRFTLAVTAPGGTHGNLKQVGWVQGQVWIYKKVPVMLRAVSFGETIQPEHWRWEERNVTFTNKGVPNRLQGQRYKRSVAQGQILWATDLEAEFALKRGETVKVFVTGEGWQFTLQGQAMESGALGEMVSVLNPNSQKTFMAQVIGQGEVRVQ